MANKKNWLGMLAMALVFGLALSGCKNDAGVQDVSISDQAPAPGNVTVSRGYGSNSGNIIITFDLVDNATGYTVYYREKGYKEITVLGSNAVYNELLPGKGTISFSSSLLSGSFPEIGLQTNGLYTDGSFSKPSTIVWKAPN